MDDDDDDVHHLGEVALDAHWHCSREEHEVVPWFAEVVHSRRALSYVDVLVADLLGESHDIHGALVSTLRCDAV